MISTSSGSDNLPDDNGEELIIEEDFADWTVRNAFTKSAFQEAIGILRRFWHRFPKDACSLLHTPRDVQSVTR